MGWKEKNRPADLVTSYWVGGHHGNIIVLRNPRTTQERRTWDKDFGRAKRSPHNLVNAYDDIFRSDATNRNWKHYRNTQYK